MKPSTTALWSGIIFGLGLGLSQMTRPPKILGFLNIFGDWDPTLLVVFAAAAGVYLVAFHFFIGPKPKASLPSRKDIDASLIFGAILFGLGWGLVGLCPGPAITNAMSFKPEIYLFLAAMIAGMYANRLIKI